MGQANGKTKIVLTGGHAGTTAISVVEELAKESSRYKRSLQGLPYRWEIHWIGASSAVEGKKVATLEKRVLPRMGVSFHSILTGRLQKKWTVHTLPSILKIPLGFFHAVFLLLKIRPKIILSFGGFAALPVVVVGFFLRIPVIIHEQTVAVGLANKFSSFFARKITISRDSSREFFPRGKTVLVGNPVMTSITKVLPKTKLAQPPTLLIVGGSRGAQRINRILETILSEILDKFFVIHQTGEPDYQRFSDLKNSFPAKKKDRYEVYNFIDPAEIASVYRKADIVISRSGANTISELLIIQRPSILIPIPWTRYDEQTKNAKVVEEAGLGVVLEEKNLSGEHLMKKLLYVLDNWGKMSGQTARKLTELDLNASTKLVSEIKSLCEK